MATLPSPFTASSLEPAAWRRLTDAEIRWNAELIKEEALPHCCISRTFIARAKKNKR